MKMALAGLRAENLPTLLVLLITFVVVLVFLKKRIKSSLNIPTGPATVPFFGNLLSIKQHDAFLDQLLTWSKEHGAVYSLYFGGTLMVIVSGFEAVKDLTCKTGFDFADRGENLNSARNPNRLGLFDTKADETWKRQRKFALATLRGMGFGKVSLEPLIKGEIMHAISYFKTKQQTLLDPSTAFGLTSSNIINQLVFHRRVDHGSKSGDELVSDFRNLMVAKAGVVLHFFPFLWPVMKHTGKFKKFFDSWENIRSTIHREIKIREERIGTCKGEPEINDFVDAYLIHRRTDPENYSLEALDYVLVDLFLGGTDTLSTTMTWAVVYLVNHPKIQQKIHDEIINEIGYKDVLLAHRSGLPYIQAAILEVQRLATVAPLAKRQAARDTSLGGYKVPKGSNVFPNFWSLHHDPQVWKDPKQFKPERFLDDEGNLAKQPESFLPFSAGKRMCMGDQLAKMELFLFFASMVQQVKFSLPPGLDALPSDGLFDLIRKPKPFHVHVSTWSD